MAWYYKTWFVILMLIIIFPIGLILMWKSPNFGTPSRVIVTVLFVGFSVYAYTHPTPTSERPAPAPTKVEAPPPRQYAAVDANTMMNDLERNAAAAQKKYKGQLLCVTGRIGAIDSDGDYIVLLPDNEFAITGITCRLNGRDKSQEQFLLQVQMGQRIRAYGEIEDVGEVAGYTLRVDKFEP